MDAVNPEIRYGSRDLTVLVPTFRRPAKLRQLLESIADQSAPVGRVIVVDGDEDAQPAVEEFRGSLPVEYHRCHPPGQIRQRNHGLALLGARDRLVALFDDDIVLLPGAIEEMVAFWNRAPEDTAGVAFNVVNGEPPRHTALRGLLGLSAPEPGRVLPSGNTTAVTHLARDARVQWLPGGATVWRREILTRRRHQEVQARWAIAEDLIFSYPVGKELPLFVCARAQVHHLHEADYGRARQERYHGWTQTVWWYRFVSAHPELSNAAFLSTVALRAVGRFAVSILRSDRAGLDFALGQADALRAIARIRRQGGAPEELVQESR